MTLQGVVVFCLTIAWLVWVISRDFNRGLNLAVTLLVSMPHRLRLSFASMPDLTIHRLILVILLVYWLGSGRYVGSLKRVKFIGLLAAFASAQFLSLLFSVQPVASLKDFTAFLMEVILFYLIVSASLNSRERLRQCFSAVAVGIAIGGLLATIERYTGVNWAAWIAPSGGWIEEGAITGPYVNRILLGYGMAMGFPILVAFQDRSDSRSTTLLGFSMLSAVIAACYFSASRGPWIGMGIGAVGLLILGGSQSTRWHILRLGILAALVLVMRPGVKDTIVNLVNETFSKDTLRRSSYEYRWILWGVAFGEVRKAPEKLVLGYGGHSTEFMDLSRYFGHEQGGTTLKLGYTSWDNNYAADLIEFGYLGFITECVLYLTILMSLARWWWASEAVDRGVIGSLVVCCCVFLFALSNVYIFAPQLKFMFWSAVAMAAGLQRQPATCLQPNGLGGRIPSRIRRRRLGPGKVPAQIRSPRDDCTPAGAPLGEIRRLRELELGSFK